MIWTHYFSAETRIQACDFLKALTKVLVSLLSPSFPIFFPGVPAEFCGWLVGYQKTIHNSEECRGAC